MSKEGAKQVSEKSGWQTSVFHTVRCYKPRLKNILILNNKEAR